MKTKLYAILALIRDFLLAWLCMLLYGILISLLLLTVLFTVTIFLIFAIMGRSKQPQMDIESVFFWAIAFLFTIWLLTCLLICLYWVFKPAEWFWVFKPAEWFWRKHKYLSLAIGCGGLFGCVFIMAAGIYLLLWFLPDEASGIPFLGRVALWFSLEDFPVRGFTALAIGIIATLALWYRFYQALEQKLQLDKETQIRGHVEWNMYRLRDPLKRDLTFAEFKRRKQELKKLWDEEKLRPFQEVEWIALEQVCELVGLGMAMARKNRPSEDLVI